MYIHVYRYMTCYTKITDTKAEVPDISHLMCFLNGRYYRNDMAGRIYFIYMYIRISAVNLL